MKLKFLSFALATVALASCSSDDLNVNGTADTQLKDNQVFAYIADPDDEAITRAGWAIQYTSTGTIKQQAMFQAGDVFKMYKTNTWKPQLLKFVQEGTVGTVNGGVFEWADGTSKLNDGADATDMTNREYAVFPVGNDAYFQFVDENRSKLGYHIDNVVNYGEFSGVASTVKDGFTIYPSIFPLFGFADANNSVKFNHMTSIVRAYIQGLKGGIHTLTLISTDGKQLSGDFESTGFNAADYTTADLPVFDTKVATDPDDTELTVTFLVEGDGVDQCIFLPVPTGDYNLDNLHLMIDYRPLANKAALEAVCGAAPYDVYDDGNGTITDAEYDTYLAAYNPEKQAATIDWTLTYKDGDDFIGADMASIAAATNKTVKANYDGVHDTYHLGVGIKLLATKKASIVFNASTLSEINNYMNTLANFGRPVEATITLTGNIDVKDPLDPDYTSDSKFLNLPELQNDVKITFKAAGATQFVSNNLVIKDKGTPSSAKNFEIELGDNVTMPQGISYYSKNNFKFASATANAAGVSTIETTGKVNLGVAFSGAVTIANAGDLTISKDPTQDLVVTTPTVTITDKITTSVTTTGAAVTVNAPAGVGNEIVALNVNGGTVTITGGTVTTLTVDKDVTALTMTGGKITTLQGTAAGNEFANGGNLAIVTSGAASIYEIGGIAAAAAGKTAAVLTFNSTYTGEAADAAKANAGVVPIYTAGQLANIAAATSYQLITNVTIGAAWTSKNLSGAFDGGSKTITGLDAPLFGNLTNGGGVLEVKDLTLASVAITSKANAKQAGALAKTITGTWKISGVDAAGTIGTPVGVGTLQTVQLGGLVGIVGDGATATDVEIYNSHIDGTVQGFAKMGGLVGELNVAKIHFTHNSPNRSKLTVLRTVAINTDEVEEYGMAGTFIGTVTGADNDIHIGKSNEYFSDYISQLNFDTTSANLWFAKCKDNEGKSFVGMTASGNQARTVNLIGYSKGEVAAGKLKFFDNTYYVTATRELANAAGDGKALMTIANYVNYFVAE